MTKPIPYPAYPAVYDPAYPVNSFDKIIVFISLARTERHRCRTPDALFARLAQ